MVPSDNFGLDLITLLSTIICNTGTASIIEHQWRRFSIRLWFNVFVSWERSAYAIWGKKNRTPPLGTRRILERWWDWTPRQHRAIKNNQVKPGGLGHPNLWRRACGASAGQILCSFQLSVWTSSTDFPSLMIWYSPHCSHIPTNVSVKVTIIQFNNFFSRFLHCVA